MRTALPLLLLIGCTASDPETRPGDVVINEFMASNAATHPDEGGAFPDWIELYNKTDSTVKLKGYSISDDATTPDRAPLDGLEIPGKGYLVLFADGDITEGPLHLPFRLKAAGEELVLSDPDGPIDDLTYANHTPDISEARETDAAKTWIMTDAPTPGASNGG